MVGCWSGGRGVRGGILGLRLEGGGGVVRWGLGKIWIASHWSDVDLEKCRSMKIDWRWTGRMHRYMVKIGDLGLGLGAGLQAFNKTGHGYEWTTFTTRLL